MAHTYDFPVELAGKRRIDANVHGHLIRTDQPLARGGQNDAPTPFDLFLASIGTCAGLTVQTFCAKREIVSKDIAILTRIALDDDGLVEGVEVQVTLPATFPARYASALEKVVAQCTVARSLQARPTFKVTTRNRVDQDAGETSSDAKQPESSRHG